MTDALKRPYGLQGPAEPPTEEERQRAADEFLPRAEAGYWTPPQTVVRPATPEEPRP